MPPPPPQAREHCEICITLGPVRDELTSVGILASLRLLALPSFSHGIDIKPTPLRPSHDGLCPAHNRRINHLPIEGPRASSRLARPVPLARLLVRHYDPDAPLHLALGRGERPLHDLDLRGVDALLPVEPHPLAVGALLPQAPDALVAPEGGANQVDGGREPEGPRVRRDRGPRVQEFLQRRRPRKAQVQREVLGREDQA